MELTKRQKEIAKLIKEYSPITGDEIAAHFHVTKSALRPDLEVLTMLEIIAAKRKLGYYYVGHQVNPLVQKIHAYKAKDFMTSPILVDPDTSVYDVTVLLFTEDVGTIFVSKKEELLGVISRKDLLKAALGYQDLHHMPISMIMTPKSKIVHVHSDDDLVTVVNRLIQYEVDCVPVLEADNIHICGRISKTAITKIWLELEANENTL